MNKDPSNVLERKTPYIVLYGTLPNLTIPRDVYTLSNHKGKLDSRVKKYAFLGYKAEMKGFVTYDLSSREISTSRHVVFYEHIFPCVSQHRNPSSQTPTSTLTINIEPISTSILDPNHGKSNQDHYEPETSSPLSTIHDQSPLDLEMAHNAQNSLEVKPKLATYSQAIKIICWALEANHIWKIVKKPIRVKPIRSKWVYKIKRKLDGLIEKYNV
ncbi:hypothetical protein CR513_01519, partial [Mucuna pruriens]